jgi:hypothetical protein
MIPSLENEERLPETIQNYFYFKIKISKAAIEL